MSTFGIDFGTSNSGVVGISGPAYQHFGEGGEPFPSIAAIEIATDRIRTGRWVWERRAELTEQRLYRVVTSVKQHLDTPQEWVSHGRRWTPEDIAYEILRSLKDEVRERTGERIDRATISIPVGFTPGKRQSLRRAAQRADIRVTAFISEPTAALLRYLGRLQHCTYAAVFDWGGGTLDISVLSIYGRTIQELGTASLHEAGDDIDRDIARALHAREMVRRGESIAFDAVPPSDRDLLITHCERAKRELSDHEEASVALFSYVGKEIQHRITRDQLGAWISPRVERAVDLLKRTIGAVPLSLEAINALVVTGGSSRLLLLRERLQEGFPTALFSPEPEWDVAHGAAVLEENPGGYEMAEGIGLVLSDGSFHPLLPERTRPSGEPRSVSLALVEDAPEANLVLARGRPDGGNNELVLTMNIPALGFDKERIDLSYTLNDDLILQLNARSHALGANVSTHFDRVRFTYQVGTDV
jgi:molecular chaperone DnaK